MSEHEQLRTIISWDVGICNLAYCIVRERASGEPKVASGKSRTVASGKSAKVVPNQPKVASGKSVVPEILEWDSINLLCHETYDCCGKLKKGTGCKQKAKYMLVTPAETHYLCTRHSKEADQIWSEDDLSDCYQPIFGEKCDYLARTGTKCSTTARFRYLDQTNLCTVHHRSHRKQSTKAFSCRPIPKETTKNTSTAEIQLRLYQTLDRDLIPLFQKHGVSEMVIENQPAPKNSGMKAIATSLFAWAVIRGQVDCIDTPGSRSPDQPVLKVRFVSASNKMKLELSGGAGTGQEEIDQAKRDDPEFSESKRYNLTKKLGLKHTRQMIADQPEWLEVLDRFKNPFDPCDAFLLGMHALEKE